MSAVLNPEVVPADADPPIRVEVHPGCQAVVEFDPALTFDCVDDCTWCCHHGVLLYDADFLELADHADLKEATTVFRGERFVEREDKSHEHHGDDGAACHFLDGEGLCELHAENDWKPARCSVFPLAVYADGGDVHVDVRESARDHCDGLHVGERRVIRNIDAFLPERLWDVEDPDTRVEL